MRFLHIRPRLESGVYLSHGGLTIGYEKMPEESTYLVTFARCSPEDVWNRQKAIAMCMGRLCKGKFVEVVVPEGQDKYKLFRDAAAEFETKLPIARKAGLNVWQV